MRVECEEHHTPARDNQYRATARYYKDSCPYCEIDRLKEELIYAKEMANAFMDERNKLKAELDGLHSRIDRLDALVRDRTDISVDVSLTRKTGRNRVRLSSIPLLGYFWHLGQQCQRVGVVGGYDIAIKPDGNKVFVPGDWKVLPAP